MFPSFKKSTFTGALTHIYTCIYILSLESKYDKHIFINNVYDLLQYHHIFARRISITLLQKFFFCT